MPVRTLFVAALLVLGAGVRPAAGLELIVDLPEPGHPIGHAAVRVRTFDADGEAIFDFGRYGRTWGELGMSGEGILRVFRGPRQVRHYLEHARPFRNAKGFEIAVTEDEERAIHRFYEDQVARGVKVRDHGTHVRYRLPDDYNGVTVQCMSTALAGLKAVWPRERWERLVDPRFNVGQGFGARFKRYYFARQQLLGVRDTHAPLDVVASLTAARQADPAAIRDIRHYSKTVARPPSLP